ncbi:MAG: phosphate ABC transporter permease PstA [Thermoleophilia bacterium]
MSPPVATGVAEPLVGSAAPPSLRRPLWGRIADRAYLIGAGLCALAAIAIVTLLIVRTATKTGPVWSHFGVWGFLTGTKWIISPASGEPIFGALPFIYGTLATSAIAMALAVPFGVGIALATTIFLPKRARRPIASVVDLLAAVPSVVYGFWGVVVLVPWAKPGLNWITHHNPVVFILLALLLGGVAAFATSLRARVILFTLTAGFALLALLGATGAVHMPVRLLGGPVLSGSYAMSGLVLAIMVLPTVTAITREVLATVPGDQLEAAYALGATRWEMVTHSVLPWARSGIVGASALGLGRAMGETIALALVLGNTPNVFGSILGPGSTVAGVIAQETPEADGLHLAALTALAIILFVLTMVVNGLARLLVRRAAPSGRRRRLRGEAPPVDRPVSPGAERETRAALEALTRAERAVIRPVSRERALRSRTGEVMVFAAVAIGMIPLVLILGKVIAGGIHAITPDFFTNTQPTDPNDTAGSGIGNAFTGTLIMLGLATLFSAPLGVMTSLFLAELNGMGRRWRRLAAGISYFVDVLLGMPSIVAGLTVYLVVVLQMGHFSALAGGLALAIVMFPIVVRSADEVLRLVPQGRKEAALALGAPRWRTAWSIVLPAAAPGILTGIVLAMARAAGETAPLLFTSLNLQQFSTDVTGPMAAVPQVIYTFLIQVRTDKSIAFAWGATFVLVSLILVLNLVARLIARTAGPSEQR